MINQAIPLLHISSSVLAEDFYCHKLGFKKVFANRPNSATADPCYLGISRDDVVIHLSSFSGDGVFGHVVNLVVNDIDTLHQEFVLKGIEINLEPTNQTWGNREMYIRDADDNCIRFLQEGTGH